MDVADASTVYRYAIRQHHAAAGLPRCRLAPSLHRNCCTCRPSVLTTAQQGRGSRQTQIPAAEPHWRRERLRPAAPTGVDELPACTRELPDYSRSAAAQAACIFGRSLCTLAV